MPDQKASFRLALVADIHGNLAALEAVAADIRRRGVDQTLNLGDNLSGPLLPLETAHFLMASGWIHAAGNHDRWMLTQAPGERGASDEYACSQLGPAERKWLASLPTEIRPFPGIFGCHATPADDNRYLLEVVERGGVRPATQDELESRLGGEPSPLVVCGHSHLPRAVRTRHGQWIVNPGSVGLPAYDDVLPEPHVVETGSPDARYAIIERAKDGWIVSLISAPYDFKPMAGLAKRRGRSDWERALLTGHVR